MFQLLSTEFSKWTNSFIHICNGFLCRFLFKYSDFLKIKSKLFFYFTKKNIFNHQNHLLFSVDEKGRDLGVDCTIGCTDTPQVIGSKSKNEFKVILFHI